MFLTAILLAGLWLVQHTEFAINVFPCVYVITNSSLTLL